MLRVLRQGAARSDEIAIDAASDWTLPADAVWIDLIRPTREEELAVEAEVGVPVPTRDEMAEIEATSRLYQSSGATYMTALVVAGAEDDLAVSEPVTFVLSRGRLVTVRYGEPRAFATVVEQVERRPELYNTGQAVLLALLEALVDRLADILERASAEVEANSQRIFDRSGSGGFAAILTGLGRAQNTNAKVRDSLVSLSRLISFAGLTDEIPADRHMHGRLKPLQRDVRSLTDHATYLSSHITFLLDAALGLINIEQNSIIKIFSVGAVCLMPPTLVASVYGMNFRHMPELHWLWGYPLALGVMVVSGVIPLLLFRRKGWL